MDDTLRDMYREMFGNKCPYTGKPCDSWVCADCEVEKEDVEWIEGLKAWKETMMNEQATEEKKAKVD